ncbi:MAG: hypothetical protein PHX34_01345 [Candidatus Shapirobacteria bacterium]|nr:hypothetical protein [Candidatus Shapirobacteria bacterium]
MEPKNNNIFGYILIIILFILITVAGYFSYQSIDWNVLKKIESQPLILPTPIPIIPSINISTNSAISSSSSTVSSSQK